MQQESRLPTAHHLSVDQPHECGDWAREPLCCSWRAASSDDSPARP